jgi:hypothetical protein
VLGKPSRRLWIAAIFVAAVCVSGLAYGLITDWDTPADTTLPSRDAHRTGGSGFGVGVMVGIGAGIAIGSLIALRKQDRS